MITDYTKLTKLLEDLQIDEEEFSYLFRVVPIIVDSLRYIPVEKARRLFDIALDEYTEVSECDDLTDDELLTEAEDQISLIKNAVNPLI